MTEKDQEITRKSPARTKKAQVLTLLQRKSGASLDQLVKATGWQTHSVRAALCRLRQQGLEIERIKAKGISRYRITPRKAA